MANALNNKGKFGTAPVFLTAISTILGAIMFLRFGYAVGAVGILGTMLIVVIGHLVTIPTALSLAEIATNQKVEGGGEYFVISRSFGLSIGAAVGIALYLSQAVSVAFYIIAFAESFAPLMDYVNEQYGLWIHIESTKKLIGIIVTLLLALLMTTKGANFGMGLLYIVVGILALVLILFFMGTSIHAGHVPFKVLSNDDFFKVFAIIFPAFTGMTAGVGLSGDLKDHKKSIPLGTIMATVLGMIIYLFITLKIGNSATPEILMSNENQLIMSDIALIGYLMIPIGLAASTISSALGSIMVAPRTLNAIAADKIIPSQRLNRWLAFLKKENNEPTHAAIVTSTIAFVFVFLGDVDVVAKIISMFFMVTYGALNLISLLENFAANPGYRPAFKSKWYISLIGTIMCIWLMFKMNPGYAFLSVVIMIGIYFLLNRHQKKSDLASIFSGVIFQISRNINVFLQKVNKGEEEIDHWRPSVVCVSKNSFERFAAFDLLRWISHRIGFGTFIHHIDGYLSKETNEQAQQSMQRLIHMNEVSKSSVYMDTLVNPEYSASISQVLQLPGVSGKENNMMMFEYAKHNPQNLNEIVDNLGLVRSVGFDTCILGSSDKDFGFNNEIHIWITSNDYANANLMIYLAYIVLGHPDWKNGLIKLYAVYPKEDIENQRIKIMEMVNAGRLPISANNIEIIPLDEDRNIKDVVNSKSKDADLTILGFRFEKVKNSGVDYFGGFEEIGDTLFVSAIKEKEIK